MKFLSINCKHLTYLAKLAKIRDMKTVSIHDAKTNLSKYIAIAKKGEKVFIGGFGKAEVMLVKLPAYDGVHGNERSFAIAKGKVSEKPGAFATVTDQNIATLMYSN